MAETFEERVIWNMQKRISALERCRAEHVARIEILCDFIEPFATGNIPGHIGAAQEALRTAALPPYEA